ncbi:MAG TPA: sigma-70 family RNA polymerase sigma factor [Polyangiaceae bacterium]|nr:sigma-70 family RNA polymerase sigma factor [Polyangiaceae bacterium]
MHDDASAGERSDAQLLECWSAGDESCGQALFDRYYAGLARFFRCAANDRGGELVQKTLLGCLEGRSRLRAHSSFRAYLFGVAHNVLRSEYRARKRDAREPNFSRESADELAPGPEGAMLMKQEHRILLRALRRIPLELQVMTQLRYWDDLSVKEIAEALGLQEGTAKTAFRRARALLEAQIVSVAESPEAAQSTLDNLDAWVAEMRSQGQPASVAAAPASGSHGA